MRFEVVDDIANIETFAVGSSIRELPRLNRIYGRGRWRKRKGVRQSAFRMARPGLPNYTGTKPLALAGRNSRSSDIWIDPMTKTLVICVENDGYLASLEKRKLYEVIPDAEGERHGQIRVKDESGEDYLYPKELFIAVEFPSSAKKAVIKAA